ncbi:MAG: hypothetical protein U9R34_00885 [Nanoarchaeota archaeon]|nr:hypothetical protein [Nanoarchaeota archaeon]
MQRKLIQLSPSTAVVSLPALWIKANGLKKGTSLSVDINENKIIVSVQTANKLKEILVDISKYKGRLMWVAIDTAYTAGYDSIIIKTKDVKQSSYMTKVVRFFPGMMIIDERKNHVQFKSIEESPIDINKILKRLFNLNLSLLEDSIESIKSKEWNDLSRVKHRDYVINSYVSYCFRSINKFGYTPFSKIGVMHSFLKIFEMFSDKLCSLFEIIAEHKAKSVKLKTLQHITEMLKQVRHIHFKYSEEAIIKIEMNRQELIKFIAKMPPYTTPFLKDIENIYFALIELEMQLHY